MARLPAHLEVAGMVRGVQAAGGFAAVLHKGDRDAGTILVVALVNGGNSRLFERMPSLEGERPWTVTNVQTTDNTEEFDAYWRRRAAQDPDVWVIELDIANPERFIGFSTVTD
ncbi:MAG: DUF1491 family protein [Novosphingobium sp.]